ncbi:hypothetical protein Bhyg_05418 [Pseudolycoriella hygida]|uniref:Uncharacterized protein n=1 Tax=Pseudolycoriella hygida TaxID=35572 RepID=A0A9Q0NHC8_9DIPT|nr:hypothetical protein Bhyg_05418 [Pseudolycoriella hygida]
MKRNIELLGAPLTLSSAKDVLLRKLNLVKASFEKLCCLKSHIAYFLLKQTLFLDAKASFHHSYDTDVDFSGQCFGIRQSSKELGQLEHPTFEVVFQTVRRSRIRQGFLLLSATNQVLSTSTFRIAVALRYGCDVCVEHDCICGEAVVNPDGIHGLSCRRSAGRCGRHVEFNKIIKFALASAQIPSRLQPPGLNIGIHKRPDRITLAPYGLTVAFCLGMRLALTCWHRHTSRSPVLLVGRVRKKQQT